MYQLDNQRSVKEREQLVFQSESVKGTELLKFDQGTISQPNSLIKGAIGVPVKVNQGIKNVLQHPSKLTLEQGISATPQIQSKGKEKSLLPSCAQTRANKLHLLTT